MFFTKPEHHKEPPAIFRKLLSAAGIYDAVFSAGFQKIILAVILYFSCTSCDSVSPKKQEASILPPEELYEELFYTIQRNNNIFSDSKTFVDCIPLYEPEIIRNNYANLHDTSTAALQDFIRKHFIVPDDAGNYVSDSLSVGEHITALWDILKRLPDDKKSGTLIPLYRPYIVPGGRFREIYYWDSYFTMLGLKADGRDDIISDMVANFSDLIDATGYIPNGNRTYYLGRSQPPFFALMIDLLAGIQGTEVYVEYLPQLKMEYEFWMNNSGETAEDGSYRRTVKMAGGEILNRYWDENTSPRPESYREDLLTAHEALKTRPGKEDQIYRHIRAAAESGWDFSSRWLDEDESGLHTIHTTNIIPVDLNCLMYHLEFTIAKACSLSHKSGEAELFLEKSRLRKHGIIKYCWNSASGFFMDYNFKNQMPTMVYSLAGAFPLFFQLADSLQAKMVAGKIRNAFLKEGGLVSTLHKTGQQWDAPNGWAPLHWITIQGLRHYKHRELASEIKKRWLETNIRVYNQTYRLFEKYNVEDVSLKEGGGEYPTQDGFGWTNGVLQALLTENPATFSENTLQSESVNDRQTMSSKLAEPVP